MKTLRNSVHLIGNLGADPEIKELESGKKVAQLSIATSSSYKNQAGEKVTNTEWHRVVAWGKAAEIAESYFHKGDEIAIEGKLTTRTWDDKDGEKHYITEVQANEMLKLKDRSAEK